MTPTEQAEAELTDRFIQHHTLDDSQNSYVHNGQWAYALGYRAGLKQAASPKRKWVGLTGEEHQWIHDAEWTTDELVNWIEAKLKEKNA